AAAATEQPREREQEADAVLIHGQRLLVADRKGNSWARSRRGQTPESAWWAAGRRPQGAVSNCSEGGQAQVAGQLMLCSSAYSARPKRPPSGPSPDSLKPPKGASAGLLALLIDTPPTRSFWARARPRSRSRVRIPAAKP